VRPVNPGERVPWGSSSAAYDYQVKKEKELVSSGAALSYNRPVNLITLSSHQTTTMVANCLHQPAKFLKALILRHFVIVSIVYLL